MATNILQWNCEGIQSKFTFGDIHQLIKETKSVILCLQETKLPAEKVFKIKGFRSYLQNLEVGDRQVGERRTAHGGVGIFVKNFASSYRVDLQTDLQAVAVSVKVHKRITVCSLYLPPSKVVSRDQLQNLIDQLPKPFLLLGDFNAHHSMWHDPREIDERGKMVVEFVAANDIALLDKNKMTSLWKVDKSPSHIDLSICSTELLSVFDWDVHEEPLNSDHFPILLRSDSPNINGGPAKWLLEKADWAQYQESTESDKDIEEFSSVDEAASFFENHIREAAKKSIPRTKGTRNRRSPPWWNGKCRALIQRRKAAFRRYRRATTGANYSAFSRARAEARRQVKKSKKDAWQELIDSISYKSTSKEIWRKIQMLNKKYKGEMVNMLVLNKKEIRLSNVPVDCKMQLIEELCSMGWLQTLNMGEENNGVTSISVRFETDEAVEKSLALNEVEVQGCALKVELLLHEDSLEGRQPVVLDDPKDIADCLGRRFAYVSSKYSSDARFKDRKEQEEREVLDFSTDQKIGYNEAITADELEYALKLTGDSAPGPDDVCYSMLKRLAPSSKKLLLDLLNCIFKGGEFPKKWKEAFVIPILKEGKEATSASSYRPIALTSCMCKLLERIVNRRLVRYLESKGLIDKCQSGFRRGRSTLDCSAALATDVHHAFRRSQYLLCVFFDLEKAYDTCWKRLIMKQLHKFGLRGELPRLIDDFLSDRKFRVRVGSSLSEEFTQEMGVPQGGVLSCTLFNIAINTVVEVIRGLVPHSLYVDDMRIAYASTCPVACAERIQKVLDALERWSLETGFRFSTSKTEYMFFYRNLGVPLDINLRLNGKPLKQVTSKKFLGLIFDRMLNWEAHVDYLKGRCIRTMNILYMIARGNRETNSEVLLRIYRALVRSKLDYGCQVYGTAPPSMLERLDPVLHKGLRICLGAYRTSPKESLYVLAREMPLQDRRQMLQMQYYVRLRQFLPHQVPIRLDDKSLDGEYARPSNKPISLGFTVRKSITDMNIDIPQVALLSDCLLGPWERKTPDICMHLAKYSKKTTAPEEFLQHFLKHKHISDVDLYTDGSKDDRGVGAGVAVLTKGVESGSLQRRLHGSASIFTAELFAIKLALISVKYCRNVSCVVYTDSMSAVQAIQGQSQCRLVSDIFEQIAKLCERGVQIRMCWVPGHAGIIGNELADKKAKAGVGLEVMSTQEIPASDIKNVIKRTVHEKWRQRWEVKAIQEGKLKEVFPSVRRSALELGLARRDSWKVTRLQIGHTRLTHGNVCIGEEDRLCLWCHGHLSVRHILVECHNLDRERRRFYDPGKTSYRDLLTKKEMVIKVIDFLKKIDVYKDV